MQNRISTRRQQFRSSAGLQKQKCILVLLVKYKYTESSLQYIYTLYRHCMLEGCPPVILRTHAIDISELDSLLGDGEKHISTSGLVKIDLLIGRTIYGTCKIAVQYYRSKQIEIIVMVLYAYRCHFTALLSHFPALFSNDHLVSV